MCTPDIGGTHQLQKRMVLGMGEKSLPGVLQKVSQRGADLTGSDRDVSALNKCAMTSGTKGPSMSHFSCGRMTLESSSFRAALTALSVSPMHSASLLSNVPVCKPAVSVDACDIVRLHDTTAGLLMLCAFAVCNAYGKHLHTGRWPISAHSGTCLRISWGCS